MPSHVLSPTLPAVARRRRAFTLLELIVVVVVLGVLALIAIPTFRTVIDNSAEAAAEQSAAALVRAANANGAFNGETTAADLETAVNEVPGGSDVTFDSGVATVTHSRGGTECEATVSIVGGQAVAAAPTCASSAPAAPTTYTMTAAVANQMTATVDVELSHPADSNHGYLILCEHPVGVEFSGFGVLDSGTTTSVAVPAGMDPVPGYDCHLWVDVVPDHNFLNNASWNAMMDDDISLIEAFTGVPVSDSITMTSP